MDAPSSVSQVREASRASECSPCYATLAQVRDPDGNVLTLATQPSRA